MRNWIYFCGACIKLYFCRTCIKQDTDEQYTDELHQLYFKVGRKPVKADILMRICRAATPSLTSYCETDTDVNTSREIMLFFLEGKKDAVPDETECGECYPENAPVSLNKYDNSNIQEALDLIKEYDLEDNVNIIRAEAGEKDGATLGKVEVIEIKNLFIKEGFSAEFNHLASMKLSNNVFWDSVSIGVIGIGTLDAVFCENYFKKEAGFNFFGVRYVNFYQNKFTGSSLGRDNYPHLMLDKNAMKIDFVPPLVPPLLPLSMHFETNPPQKWVSEYFSENHRDFIEIHLEFNGNVIKNLFITDNHELYEVEHESFGKIYFRGKNRIEQLNMNTRHSVVVQERVRVNNELKTKIKADVDRVFFDTSDEVGVIPKDVKPIFTGGYIEKNSIIDKMDAMWRREDYASYGEFFTDLQEKAAQKNNRVLESVYARKARSYSRALMSSREDKFIFLWGDIISNGGTSWTKPLLWFLVVQTIFTIIAWFVPFVEVISSFAILWWEFLDPLSGLPSIKSSGWGRCLSLLHKVTAALVLYESIKAMRRFS